MSQERPNPTPFSPIKDIFTSPQESLLRPEDINIADLRKNLELNGFNLDLNAEVILSLRETQFRNYESGRGLAMSIVLGDKKDEFEALIQEACREHSRSIKGDKTRGARQLAADLVSVAIAALDPEEFCDRTNRRCRKSKDKNYEDPITSLPPQAAVKVIRFLIG